MNSEIKVLDLEHFYYNEVLVDLNQMQREINKLSTGAYIHELNSVLGNLRSLCRYILSGKTLKEGRMEKELRRANKAGLHTGIVFSEPS